MASERLTLTDLFGNKPAEEIAVLDNRADGVWMLIGHLTTQEALTRLHTLAGTRVDVRPTRRTVVRTWAVFDTHAEGCGFPADGPAWKCNCTWDPAVTWHRHWVTPDTPDAVPVTLVRLSETTRATAPAGAVAIRERAS